MPRYCETYHAKRDEQGLPFVVRRGRTLRNFGYDCAMGRLDARTICSGSSCLANSVCWVLVVLCLQWTLSGCRLAGKHGVMAHRLSECRNLSQQGLAAIEAQRWDEAEKLLAKAVRACPGDMDAKRYYAEALWHGGNRTAAIEQLGAVVENTVENTVENSGGDVGSRVRLGEMLLAVGQLKAARRHAEVAIDLAPDVASTWAVRARVLARMGLLEQAIADYQRSLAYGPEDRAVLLEMAEVYRELNKPQESLAVLNRLADTYPLDGAPKNVVDLQGLALAAQGRFSAAAESYGKVVAIAGATADNYFELANAQWQAGFHDKAVMAARQALALDPSHRRSQELLGRMQASLTNRPGY